MDPDGGFASGDSRQLDACVDDHFHYIFTHRRVFWADEDFPGSAANMSLALIHVRGI
jgi:hypothetical protein